jgi:hypothetical protein
VYYRTTGKGRAWRGPERSVGMDQIVKPWLDLWDYLDGNFWRVCQWAETQLTPDEVAWQPT